MHNPPDEPLAARPVTEVRHPRIARVSAPPRLLRIVLLLTFGAAGLHAGAQSTSATEADPPVIAVHYQDILASEPPFLDLFIPPPALDWSDFTYSAADCLRADGLHTGPKEKVIIIRFEVLTEGTCATEVDLLFTDGVSAWAASARVIANRLPPLPALTQVFPRFSQEMVSLPYSRPGDRPADLLLLRITNTLGETLTVMGLGNDAGYRDAVGHLVAYDPDELMDRYSDLVRNTAPFEATAIAPGDEAHFALLVAAGSRMPSGAGTVTVRPVAMVELGGQAHTIEFPRMSTAWGADLP